MQQKIKTGGFTEPTAIEFHSIDYLKYLKRAWRYGQSAFGFMAETGSVYYFHGGGLLELLMIGREYEATDPRDKVYGVLGLAREPYPRRFVGKKLSISQRTAQAAPFCGRLL